MNQWREHKFCFILSSFLYRSLWNWRNTSRDLFNGVCQTMSSLCISRSVEGKRVALDGFITGIPSDSFLSPPLLFLPSFITYIPSGWESHPAVLIVPAYHLLALKDCDKYHFMYTNTGGSYKHKPTWEGLFVSFFYQLEAELSMRFVWEALLAYTITYITFYGGAALAVQWVNQNGMSSPLVWPAYWNLR